MVNVSIRYIEKTDMDAVLECEKTSHKYKDEDFDVDMVRPWAWSEGDVLDAVRVNRNKATGDLETRALIAEIPVTGNILDNDGVEHEEITVDWLCGAFIYQPVKDGYDIWFFSVHADAPPEVGETMLRYMIKKAEQHDARKQLRIVIHDGDDTLLKFFQKQNWKIKLLRDYFIEKKTDERGASQPGTSDGWECTFLVETGEKQGNSEEGVHA